MSSNILKSRKQTALSDLSEISSVEDSHYEEQLEEQSEGSDWNLKLNKKTRSKNLKNITKSKNEKNLNSRRESKENISDWVDTETRFMKSIE